MCNKGCRYSWFTSTWLNLLEAARSSSDPCSCSYLALTWQQEVFLMIPRSPLKIQKLPKQTPAKNFVIIHQILFSWQWSILIYIAILRDVLRQENMQVFGHRDSLWWFRNAATLRSRYKIDGWILNTRYFTSKSAQFVSMKIMLS